MLNLINKIAIVIISILLLNSCVSDDSPIFYDGLRMYPITKLKEAVKGRDAWIYVNLMDDSLNLKKVNLSFNIGAGEYAGK